MSKVTIEEEKLKKLIQETVTETLQEILRDPDLGLELQDWVKERLRKEPEDLVSLGEIEESYE